MLNSNNFFNVIAKYFLIFLASFLLIFFNSCEENKPKNNIERTNNNNRTERNDNKNDNKADKNTDKNNERTEKNNRKDKDRNAQKEDDNSSKKRKSTGLISPKWGKRFYKAHNGKIEALEHIWLRHNFESKYDFVSRFAKKYNDQKSIQKLVEYACDIATKNDISQEANGHRSAVVEMSEDIGLSQRGKNTSKIQIFLDNNDFIKTAYPL